ncbi:rod shape-determining protein MreD [Erythrobacteraceae bacterium CFH 75059]|uniref:rod shape-determining protein MreD n=1 Tax=Qipengyuania thermophila TaxID=2509361 RepID=UPI001022230B|nr:rod shape-determining protein MreD [Qipengyuania thermophila]TCD05143.1 rod shape-determining protein MreD [Erythrobacteraceae bacterium CFH 75059]
MERAEPSVRRIPSRGAIERRHSVAVATLVPWLSVIAASMVPTLVIATALPLVPPTGFLLFLSWRLVRPGLLPVWSGLPLGLVDDLYSGQPFGFAIMSWSLAMLVLEIVERRFPWRSFAHDWLVAAIVLICYLGAGMILSGAILRPPLLVAMVPQLVLTILAVPVTARLVSFLDRLRLRRWRRA